VKKILFILHLPPPIHGSSMVGKYIKDSEIINSTFNSKYINLNTSKTIDEIGKKPLLKVKRYMGILFSVLIALIKFKPEVIYLAINAKGIGFYKDFPIAILAKIWKKKLVLHYHNKGVINRQQNFVDHLMYGSLFKNTKVILLSDTLYYDVKKYVKKNDVFYCPNGVPIIAFSKVNITESKVSQLLFLSNLIESKGVFVLLDSLKYLKEQGIKFQCNFVGGEGDITSEQFRKRLNELQLDENVFYLGKKYDKQKYDIFNQADIFIFPTFYPNECFPLVLLESMQFSLPAISCNEGAVSDIIEDGKTGFVIEKQNSKILAEKIKWFIDNPEKATLMGENGNEKFYKNYTLDIFEKRLTKILAII
jgi:glycosyltransferase involved in cell wall biosynthesis